MLLKISLQKFLKLPVYNLRSNFSEKQIPTTYRNRNRKSPPSSNSNPNFSQIKKPNNPANSAATPAETMS